MKTDALPYGGTAYVLVPDGRHVSEDFLTILRGRYQVAKILLLVRQEEHHDFFGVTYVHHSFTDGYRSELFLFARALIDKCSVIASPDVVVLDILQ